MWIFTTRGFFSVVEDANNNELVHVRARKLAHLHNLVREFHLDDLPKVWPKSDYRWRLIIPKKQWVAMVAKFALSIDYPKVKPAIGESQPDMVLPMLEVWETMFMYQADQEAKELYHYEQRAD